MPANLHLHCAKCQRRIVIPGHRALVVRRVAGAMVTREDPSRMQREADRRGWTGEHCRDCAPKQEKENGHQVR